MKHSAVFALLVFPYFLFGCSCLLDEPAVADDDTEVFDAQLDSPESLPVVDSHDAIDPDVARALAQVGADDEPETLRNDTSYFCVDHPCPDLAPLRNDRCYRIGNQLYVAVRNIGSATAGPSVTRVLFHNVSTQYINVSSILPNQTWSTWVTMPKVCTTPGLGCSYNVRADHWDIVNEITGANNSFSGACL